MASTIKPDAPTAPDAPRLKRQAIGIIVMLVLEYILGMTTNLFVHFTQGQAAQANWDFARTQLPLMAHIILGMLILLAAIVLYIQAVKARSRTWKIPSGIGLGSVLLTIFSGSEFVSKQSDSYSFVMSLLFIVALSSYGWGIYKSK